MFVLDLLIASQEWVFTRQNFLDASKIYSFTKEGNENISDQTKNILEMLTLFSMRKPLWCIKIGLNKFLAGMDGLFCHLNRFYENS